MSFSFVFKNQLLRYSFLLLILFPVSVFANVQEETSKGDAAFKMGKMKKAEKYYSSALKMDPDNWRIMRGLAETKFILKKIRRNQEACRSHYGHENNKEKHCCCNNTGQR